MFQELFTRVDRFLDILQQFADTYEYSFEDECEEGEEEAPSDEEVQ